MFIHLSKFFEIITLKSFDGVKKYVYRDLKSDNILLINGAAFLCDFGSVKYLEHELTGSIVISIAWAAPEMLIPYKIINKGKPIFNYNSSADIYSFGLLLYSLITGDTLSSQGQLTEIVGTNPQKPRDNKITRYYEKKGGINQNEIDELKRQTLHLFSRKI